MSGIELSVATWNIGIGTREMEDIHRNRIVDKDGNPVRFTPAERLNGMMEFCDQHSIDVVAIQEAARSLMHDHVSDVGTWKETYETYWMGSERPDALTRRGYVILIRRTWRVNSGPGFFEPDKFRLNYGLGFGGEQYRPPVVMELQRRGQLVQFYTWHNEEKSSFADGMFSCWKTAINALNNPTPQIVLAGDLNIRKVIRRSSLPANHIQLSLGARQDHIVSNCVEIQGIDTDELPVNTGSERSHVPLAATLTFAG